MPNDCYTNMESAHNKGYYLFLHVNLSSKLIVYISISILKQTITLSEVFPLLSSFPLIIHSVNNFPSLIALVTLSRAVMTRTSECDRADFFFDFNKNISTVTVNMCTVAWNRYFAPN